MAVTLTATTTIAQDAVLRWNGAALDAIRIGNTPPPAASRNLAILHLSMHDAVNGIHKRYEQYLVKTPPKSPTSDVAAATSAARHVLVALYPSLSANFDALNDAILKDVKKGASKDNGIAWGEAVAKQMLASRANDGSTASVSYPGSTVPGLWRPTISFGGVVRPALLPQWGNVTPFALTSAQQFQIPPPPALTSEQYTVDQLIVQWFGRDTSPVRTPEQTEIAWFWGYGPGTATPPGHWNEIATVVATKHKKSLSDNARTYALLNIAMADAAILCWNCKYLYGLWRPITAVQLADQDGNPWTQPDPKWLPLLPTPPFPEYTSGHSTFSGAAATVLASVYSDKVSFKVGSDDLPNVERSFKSFSQAALESGISRIYGGIHYWSANVNGLVSGWQTARWAVETKLRKVH